MKKLDLGQSFGVLANIGVVVGIVLLAYELNQNRQLMRAQTRNEISQALVGMLTLQANSPELSLIQLKRGTGEPLTPLEQTQYISFEGAYWRYRENVHYQYRNGLYDDSEYLAQRQVWVREINTEDDSREIYCSAHSSRSRAFTDEIDALMDAPCE